MRNGYFFILCKPTLPAEWIRQDFTQITLAHSTDHDQHGDSQRHYGNPQRDYTNRSANHSENDGKNNENSMQVEFHIMRWDSLSGVAAGDSGSVLSSGKAIQRIT